MADRVEVVRFTGLARRMYDCMDERWITRRQFEVITKDRRGRVIAKHHEWETL